MKMKLASLLSITLGLGLAFGGCGGGNGSDSHNRTVEGTWTGALTKVEDTCPGSAAPQTINFSHAVQRNESAVTVIDQAGIDYLGNLVGDNGFSADANTTGSIGGAQCSVLSRLSYDGIDIDTDDTASLELTITRSCQGNSDCTIRYSGTASRTSPATGATSTPTGSPTVAPTGTDLSGGCAAMNPNTEAGFYAGDGGCGLSEAVFRFSGNSIVLEPFGSNGATSFVIDSANTSSATSANSDLTIQGSAGYSCSMVCSPPGTFTVSCFKEGGTQCTEKF